MNTLQIQCFLEVADQLSYAKAAQTLHLSQPAVTKKIKSLEDELQVKLFDRDTRHVSLTEEGRLFYPNALSIYTQERNIRSSLLHSRQKKQYHLFIGAFGQEVHLFLDQVLWNVREALPNLKVDIVGASFEPLSSALETRSMDIVIGEKELFESKRVFEEHYDHLADMPLMLAMPGRLEMDPVPENLSFSDLTPDDLQKYLPGAERLTSLELDHTILQAPGTSEILHRFFDHTVTCDNMEAACSLVRAGFGYMILPESPFLMRDKIRYYPLQNTPVFHYGCFYQKSNDNRALKILLNELHAYFDPEKCMKQPSETKQ